MSGLAKRRYSFPSLENKNSPRERGSCNLFRICLGFLTVTPKELKINFIKLKKYLKEICERQKNAVLRNQEFLKEFDRIEAHIRTFTSSEALQKLKVQYEGEIKSMLSLQKNSIPIKGDKEDNNEQMLPVARQAGINTRTATSRGLYHPATIFMGRQMSAISSIEDFSTQQKSSQPTKSFSVFDPHSCRQAAQSSNMTDSYVVQTNSDIWCLNKSDKIDGKTYLQMGEKMPVTSSVSSENGRTHCVARESNTHDGNSNLVESKKSAQLISLLRERLSPENRITDLKSECCSSSVEEIVTKEHFVAHEERSKQPIPLVSAPEQLVSGNEQPRESFPAQHTDRLWPSENTLELEDESLDSSSDLTVSVSEEDQIINTVELQQRLGDTNCKMALKSTNSEQEKETLSTKESFSLQTVNSHTTDEDSSANSATRQSDLPLDFAMLWERLCKHILFLKKHHVLLKEEVPLLLREVLPEECGDRSSIHGNESFYHLLSILNDNGEIKQTKHAQWLDSIGTREQVFAKCLHLVFILTTGLNIGSTSFKTEKINKISSEASFSSSEGRSHLSSRVRTFWGESDDSNSEIEAALRPQTHDTYADEFDDFYD
uniref:Centrosomal protein kizuna n=1 Tax=Chelydra serpentina TaxID=8475 RepID=A0A8C3XQ94_CHESE